MADQRVRYVIEAQNLLSKVLQDAEKDADRLDNKMKSVSKTSMMGDFIKGSLISSGIQGLSSSLLGLGKHILDNTIKFQGFENAIMASSRSEAEGKKNIAFLNSEIKYLGLNLDAAYEGYKTFSGAMMGTSLQGEKANKIFRQLSEASAVMHLGAEEQKGAFLALGQMMSKGKVQAEELRGQLGERIPGAFQIAARAMKMSTAQLDKFMSEGKLLASDFLPKFGDEMERTFGSKLPNSLNSLQANIERTSTEWENLLTNLGKSKTGIISMVVNVTRGMIRDMNEGIANENKVDDAMQRYGGGYGFSDNVYKWFGGGILGSKLGGKWKTQYQQDSDYAGSLYSTYVSGVSSEKVANENIGKLQNLISNLIHAPKSEFKNEDDRKRELAILRYTADELVGVKNSLREGRLQQSNKEQNGGMLKPMKNDSRLGTGTTITAGAPQNMYINIGKLVETLKVESVNGEIPVAQIKNQVTKLFLEVVSDADKARR